MMVSSLSLLLAHSLLGHSLTVCLAFLLVCLSVCMSVRLSAWSGQSQQGPGADLDGELCLSLHHPPITWSISDCVSNCLDGELCLSIIHPLLGQFDCLCRSLYGVRTTSANPRWSTFSLSPTRPLLCQSLSVCLPACLSACLGLANLCKTLVQ